MAPVDPITKTRAQLGVLKNDLMLLRRVKSKKPPTADEIKRALARLHAKDIEAGENRALELIEQGEYYLRKAQEKKDALTEKARKEQIIRTKAELLAEAKSQAGHPLPGSGKVKNFGSAPQKRPPKRPWGPQA